MPESPYLDVPESPEERMLRLSARRWRRRGRIVGPFLGVSVLLATLTLSVDLIEYQPQQQPERLSDRAMPAAVTERKHMVELPVPTSVSTTSVIASDEMVAAASGDEPGLDVRLAPGQKGSDPSREQPFPPPAAPYAGRSIR